LIDPSTDTATIIASGGTRGDYTAADTSNGTLFLDYSDIVARLGCGPGCSIGSNPVPEPSSLLLLGSGIAGLAGIIRRKLQK